MSGSATAERLLDAAEYRMRRGGYNAVSFRRIADDLGIRSASVHHHFARKETLTVALVERYSARFFTALDANAASADGPEDRLRAFAALYRAALAEDGAMCLCGLLGSEMAALPAPVQGAVKSFLRANIDWIAAALPDALSPGERARRADGFVAAHQGAMMLATGLGDAAIFDGIADSMIASALSGDRQDRTDTTTKPSPSLVSPKGNPMSIFTHTTVGASDRARSNAFYGPTLGTLGIRNLGELGEVGTIYGADAPAFIVFTPTDGQPATSGNGVTIGFAAGTRDAVRAFHAAGVANGGIDEGAPGPRAFTPDAYAAYLRDPDGNKICAYCFAAE